MRIAAAVLVSASLLLAQDPAPVIPAAPPQPPVLENNGNPMVVPYRCTEDDIAAAGLSCSDDEPCPVYLELSSAASSGIRLFASGNIHTKNTNLFSVLLGSDDNGKTWREVHERLRASGIDAIQFADADNGWAGGIVLSPLPQDPFLLRTTDGGQTWRKVPLSTETTYGFIQQFFFADKSSGALIIDRGPGGGDRYESYESLDGGDSWMAKQTSVKPLTLKRPANAPQPEWRVRADGNSRSFQLEHRQGSRWTSVAQFAVNLGACRPPAQ
jgi:hypothetical protein